MSMSATLEPSIQDEIIDLAETLAESEARLKQLLDRIREREEQLADHRVEELERRHKEAIGNVQLLLAEKSTLENKLARQAPELQNALAARESAFKKLKHARKVIKDLLQERGDMTSPLGGGALTQKDIEEALGHEYIPGNVSSSSSSSASRSQASDRTIRWAAALRTPSRVASPAISVRTLSSATGSVTSPKTRNISSGPSSIRSPQQSISPGSSGKGSPVLNVHFKKPPGSSVYLHGPVPLGELKDLLQLSDITMQAIYGITTTTEIGARLHIVQLDSMKANIAFVHDPIFIDTRPKSYLLDYGRIQRNQEIEQYIDRYKKFSPVFHVFTFPEKKSDWFYVGAHNLSVVVLQDSFWPLEGKSKDKMLSKLSKRSRGGISEAEMGRLLDSGELQQICVELTGIQDNTSLDFASNKLGRRSTGQLGEVRHERRAEGVKE